MHATASGQDIIEADNKKTGFTLAPDAISVGVKNAMALSLLNTFQPAPSAKKEGSASLVFHLLGEDRITAAQ